MTDIISEELVVAICFVAFVLFAYRPIKKAVFSALEQKISEIKDNLEKAENLKKEAKSILELLEKELDAVEQSKTKLLLDAQHNIEHKMNLQNEEMKLFFARIENSALQNVQYQADQATENMKKQFIEKTMTLVQNYLKETNNNSLTQQEILALFTHKN